MSKDIHISQDFCKALAEHFKLPLDQVESSMELHTKANEIFGVTLKISLTADDVIAIGKKMKRPEPDIKGIDKLIKAIKAEEIEFVVGDTVKYMNVYCRVMKVLPNNIYELRVEGQEWATHYATGAALTKITTDTKGN